MNEEKPKLGSRKSLEALYEALFGEKLGKPYKGIIEEYRNYLGKLLPKDTELTVEEIIEYCKG